MDVEVLTTKASSSPLSCVQAKGFAVKAEFEESERLGCPNKKVFDFVKNGGTFKLNTFSDYTQYMVRLRGRGRERDLLRRHNHSRIFRLEDRKLMLGSICRLNMPESHMWLQRRPQL